METEKPRVVAVVPGKAEIGRAIADDLRAGGFEVEVAPSGARALEAARGRPPAAFVVLEGMPAGWVQRLGGEPALREVPVVGITGADPERPRFVPVLSLLRCDGWVQTSAARTPGAVAGAVRAALSRGKLPPPGARERLGVQLWRAGSALAVLALAFALWMTFHALTRRPMGPAAWLFPVSLVAFPLGDLGTRLARGGRPGLSIGNWLVLGLVLAVVLSVIVPR